MTDNPRSAITVVAEIALILAFGVAAIWFLPVLINAVFGR